MRNRNLKRLRIENKLKVNLDLKWLGSKLKFVHYFRLFNHKGKRHKLSPKSIILWMPHHPSRISKNKRYRNIGHSIKHNKCYNKIYNNKNSKDKSRKYNKHHKKECNRNRLWWIVEMVLKGTILNWTKSPNWQKKRRTFNKCWTFKRSQTNRRTVNKIIIQ